MCFLQVFYAVSPWSSSYIFQADELRIFLRGSHFMIIDMQLIFHINFSM
jgi:hypothetical protein